jgi:hypothetical protein
MLLVLCSFKSVANGCVSNNTFLEPGEQVSIVLEQLQYGIAEYLLNEGSVNNIEEGMKRALKYDGVYLLLTCQPIVKLDSELNFTVRGFALVPEYQDLSRYY